MKVIVDRERCCGGGLCALNAPAVFEQSEEDGLVLLLEAEPVVADQDRVRLAAGLCPTGSIRIVAD